jgi:hypothetical protein
MTWEVLRLEQLVTYPLSEDFDAQPAHQARPT